MNARKRINAVMRERYPKAKALHLERKAESKGGSYPTMNECMDIIVSRAPIPAALRRLQRRVDAARAIRA
jgi:hypothetical protein